MNILIVDDDEIIQRTFFRYLHEVFPDSALIAASTLGEGVTLADPDKFDVLFLDLDLPDSLSPMDTIERFRHRMADIPTVILTAAPEAGELEEAALMAGAQDYLPKSMLGKHVLQRTVRHARERFLSIQQRCLGCFFHGLRSVKEEAKEAAVIFRGEADGGQTESAGAGSRDPGDQAVDAGDPRPGTGS